ncbi:hypothetical protein [Sinorhizobium medicae]|uniref:hypothetical protein n=1 Tax=Sinorhizobium medicae TaxID=110321 RepID=UPI000FDA4272|nr:hypothetical protein [Sinorhizobium medicae]RVP48120.1 hypothetical protein CN078_25595 [Sinorhizobium medicae]RVP75407.1 hypothetical protein CN079_19915 [Sinorhizobium medicae]UWU06620.1 hypothetical protein N2598_09500 [Sinorhizobium medicae]
MKTDAKLYCVPAMMGHWVVEFQGQYFAVPAATGWDARRKIANPHPTAIRHWEQQNVSVLHYGLVPLKAEAA